jgi:hypothetical protein
MHVMAIYTSVIRLKGRWLVTPATFLLQVLCGEPVLCNGNARTKSNTKFTVRYVHEQVY